MALAARRLVAACPRLAAPVAPLLARSVISVRVGGALAEKDFSAAQAKFGKLVKQAGIGRRMREKRYFVKPKLVRRQNGMDASFYKGVREVETQIRKLLSQDERSLGF